MPLSGKQMRKLKDALADAFRARSQLEMMLRLHVNKRLNDYASENLPHPRTIFNVVDAADEEGWTEELVRAALEANPGNPELRRFYAAAWFSLSAPESSRQELRRQLEVQIRPGEDLQEVDQWLDGFEQMGRRVCCIQIEARAGSKKGTIDGTGVLIADDLVLTNYHVMEPVICGEEGLQTSDDSPLGAGYAARIGDVRFRFDYRVLPDGTRLDGTSHDLTRSPATPWLVDSSRLSPLDLLHPTNECPREDELDYALVRLSRAAAQDRVANGSGLRGSVELPAIPPAVHEGASLIILQHPEGTPLKLDFNAVTKCNGNGTRIEYHLNTLGGSSGSPCFNYRWDLVALHHSGYKGSLSPPVREAQLSSFNEGVPMTAIRHLLEQRGVRLS